MPAYTLDPDDQDPLYKQLYRYLKADIESGALAAGERLPSKRRMASDLGISVVTVETALEQLSAEGWVQSKPRSGFYVCQVDTPAKGASRSNDLLASRSRADSASLRMDSANAMPGPANLDMDSQNHELGDASSGYMYDLTANKVSLEVFPFKQWARTVRSVLSEQPEGDLIEAGDPCGSKVLREQIAAFLRDSRGLEVNPDCMVVGAGSQTLYNLLVQLLGRSNVFAVEDPGYPTLTSVYGANGVEVSYLPIAANAISELKDADNATTASRTRDGRNERMRGDNMRDGGARESGMRENSDRANSMRELLDQCGASVVHVMPSHQFPTGRVMPVSERYDLLSWASESDDRYIIEDDYDSELRLQGRPVPALKGIDALGKVIYANTFTRSLAPGLRLAYMVLPPNLMEEYRRKLGFYSCTVPNITQLALASFISDGSLARHIARVRNRSRKVRDAFIEELQQDIGLPAGNDTNDADDAASADSGSLEVTFSGTDAGLHFVMGVSGLPDGEVVRRAASAGVRLKPMSAYSVLYAQGSHASGVSAEFAKSVEHWFPVSFAALTVEQARDAASRLAKALAGC